MPLNSHGLPTLAISLNEHNNRNSEEAGAPPCWPFKNSQHHFYLYKEIMNAWVSLTSDSCMEAEKINEQMSWRELRLNYVNLIELWSPHAGFAHKICTEDGTWFRHPDSNSVWSNYTTCVDHADYEVKSWSLSLNSKNRKVHIFLSEFTFLYALNAIHSTWWKFLFSVAVHRNTIPYLVQG